MLFLNTTGESFATPINIYLLNVIFPEEEIMNVGLKLSAIMPITEISTWFKRLGGRFIREAQSDFWGG